MFKHVIVVLLVTLLSGCVRPTAQPASPTAVDKKALIGIWAMLPLKNGIANVVEFRADDQVLLHSFNCENPQVKMGVEQSHYTVEKNSQTIRLTSSGNTTLLKILGIVGRAMKLKQPIGVENESLTFSYLKVAQVAPLCEMYKPRDKSPKTAFKPGDFIAAPAIPEHKDLEKFVGKWQLKKATQLEIVKDKQGRFTLFQAADDNWRYLFNNVHWVGDELNFNSYAYSEKPKLFDHPFHKSQIPTQIRLLPDDKMRMTIDIDGDKSAFELTRE
ncbi:hypothetical protein [Candidatus Symbiopectobacterium sp. NZEC135]|uniref:hypothetical protein n=1 Tax=Candidatus Symbiopectobacterium sp. NZEC135 TaxID=2820471 RepID=UPI002225F4D3|nr:hypothetical protein [Candidatus Symbiopectobacterium sp. NZEC135]MCW2481428.1 hypothetical protein [Candidatus Symbiopectobacterium sp. NZEC135]